MTSTQEREAQRTYWKEHSSNATVETMMLDSQAADIDKLERPEVLQLLGSVEGKRVVELGAGIGRFTRPLAEQAKSMVALDFMPNLIAENKAQNGHLGNIDFRCGDATELELPLSSADVVFSNWLLMYLGDEEVATLLHHALEWLAPGGLLFFRESCFRQSGDKKRGANPTHYRNPRQYFGIVDGCSMPLAGGASAAFELVCCKSVDTYVRVKQNQNQVCWKWRKVVRTDKAALPCAARHFLDGQMYTADAIARYESVFGAGFISPGGADMTRELASQLALTPEDMVLDVGCGVGGTAFLLAREKGCFVYGIDLSVNMILTALERAAASGNGDKVSLEVSDCMLRGFEEGTFSHIFSRDTLVHVHDKPTLFRRLLPALRPGGMLLLTDYCRGDSPPSPGFQAYVADHDYDLHTVAAYGDMLRAAGFELVEASDETPRFIDTLETELARLAASRAEFVAAHSTEAYDAMVQGWRGKLARARAGEQAWAKFLARKA